MKTGVRIFSVLMILTGVVWTLQGASVLPGSFMTGSTFWLVMGIIVGLAGIGVWVLAGRIGKPGEGNPSGSSEEG